MYQETQSGLTVYLIRHGETELNASGRLRGRIDVDLNANGLKQADALGALFKAVALQRIIASPLQRARQTASPVALSTGVPVEIERGFNDRDYGTWAGESRSGIETRFGSLDEAPGVETWQALSERVHQAFLQVVSTLDTGSIAIVGHDAVNCALLGSLAPDLTGNGHDIHQRTGCWNKLVKRQGLWHAILVDAYPGDGNVP